MKYGKAICRWGMAALLGLTIAVLPAAPALALDTPVDTPVNVGRSTVDSGYNFHFDFKGATQGTYWRSKDTSSSSYLRVDGSSGDAPLLYIDGAKKQQWGRMHKHHPRWIRQSPWRWKVRDSQQRV